MTAQSVCAVIVTYHPSARMLENLPQVLAQVQGLVVIDNGSSVEELDSLREKRQSFGFHLIENGENLGIAEALNQGARWAHNQGYLWIIFFDQDSGISDSFISHMFATWEAHPDRGRVGSIYPRYVDPATGIEAPVPRASDGSPVLPMTSGSLMPAWIFDKIGWFASEYFIDAVDWEYCFRIRAAGYLIADCRQAKLLHSPGSPTQAVILGRTFHLSRHSAIRRYYISRNTIVLCRKYFFSFPGWILNVLYRHLHETIICFLAEENRSRKLRNFLLGTWDGLFGRMGKREGL